MRGWCVAVALMATAVALAGCGAKTDASVSEVVVHSKVPRLVNGTAAPSGSPDGPSAGTGTHGHLAGVVVDKAIRPLMGAHVSIPGLDLKDDSRRDGSFSFVDLPASTYYVKVNLTGYYDAETLIEVTPGDISRVKFVLEAIPPPAPYHITQSWNGFAEVSDTDLPFLDAGGLFCNACDFSVSLDKPARHILLEAAMDNPTSGQSFSYQLVDPTYADDYAHDYGVVASGKLGAPLLVRIDQKSLGDATSFQLRVSPGGLPPGVEQSFKVFATAWYNDTPPSGWSVVRGDA